MRQRECPKGSCLVFGYLRPYKPEMKMKDFAVYKAVYCGLCRTLGKRYGFIPRLILSYDATLMAIISMSLQKDCCGFDKCRCPIKPYKKCDAANENPSLDYWADASVILGYHKIKDNVHDSRGAKKFLSRVALLFASRPYKKAVKNNSFLAERAAEYIEKQNEVEKARCTSIDKAAHPTAQLMAQLLTHNSQGGAQVRVLERMGYFIGRWTYLADAADDFEKDKKSGEYNPFVAAGVDDIKSAAQPLLNSCIAEITTALALLDMRRYADIINNAFYLGLPEVKKAVLSGLKMEERKKRFGAVYNI